MKSITKFYLLWMCWALIIIFAYYIIKNIQIFKIIFPKLLIPFVILLTLAGYFLTIKNMFNKKNKPKTI